MLGEFGTFEMGILERSTKLCATSAIKFATNRLSYELAAILLPAINAIDEIAGQGNGHTLETSHDHTLSMIIPMLRLRCKILPTWGFKACL
jgi:hypothetical protein